MEPWSDWSAHGTRQYRPVQYDSEEYWVHLMAARIDPVRTMGYSAKKVPVEPFLAEHHNSGE